MQKLPARLRLDELGVLVDVAETGSLAAAARRLGVPKSTVGRAIGRIEEDLGVSLVRRLSRGPGLTEPGRRLADLAAPHVAALRDATSALGRASSEAYGVLRMTVPTDVSAFVLAPLLPGFLARYPRVRPEIVHTVTVVDLVREGYDLAIRLSLAPRLKSSAMIARKLGSMPFGFYASTPYAARHPLPKHPRELADHDHVVFFRGKRVPYELRGPKGVVKVDVPARINGDDILFNREAVVAGIGIGALPHFIAKKDLAAGTITRVLPEYQGPNPTIYVVYPPAKPTPPKVAAFTAYLIEHAPRLLAES